MESHTIRELRNVVLLSHGGAGKTSLAEAMLFTTGATTRMGTIEDGNTTSDYEAEEVKRGGSTQMALVPCFWNGNKINVIDTPGYADFLGEVVAGLRVADSGIVLIAGHSGIEVGTEQMWDLLDQNNTPRVVFVNKMDRENANFSTVVSSLQQRFGRECVPTHLPVGSESGFRGVVNLLSGGQDYPQEMASEIKTGLERLIEAIAESDDSLATKYLEGEEIGEDELRAALKKAIASGQIVPVIPGAATTGLGIRELFEVIANYLPSPDSFDSDIEGKANTDPNGSLSALVFKTSADPYVGKISFFRVYSGTLKSETQIWNSAKEQTERIGQVFMFTGKSQEQASQVTVGDIGAVTKLSVTNTGDTLCEKDKTLTLPRISFPRAHHTVAVYTKSKQDVDKMSSALSRISEEDPSIRIARDHDTGEILMSGLGDVHVDVTEEKMRRKFATDLVLQVPKVPYKETITTPTKVEYKHKKQTGGHGQYGHVFLELNPLNKSGGFEFSSRVVGGNVPREYFPAVEKGVVKSMEEGTVAGYPVVDIGVVLYDGSFHPVDSSGMAFEIAGGYAFRKGLGLAQPVILEPIMKAEVKVPDMYTGEVSGDLNTKRARILGMIPQDGYTTIDVEVPQSEMLRYSTDLRSLTQGRGSFSIEFDHYEAAPSHVTQKIVASTNTDR